jgi:hypothetical protein
VPLEGGIGRTVTHDGRRSALYSIQFKRHYEIGFFTRSMTDGNPRATASERRKNECFFRR